MSLELLLVCDTSYQYIAQIMVQAAMCLTEASKSLGELFLACAGLSCVMLHSPGLKSKLLCRPLV